jgi:hypothetical protein
VDNLPHMPDFELIKQYGMVGFLFWLMGKFGQRILDFCLEKLGLNIDRRTTDDVNVKAQLENMRKEIQTLRIEVGILRNNQHVASSIGGAIRKKLVELKIEDSALDFLIETLIKFSEDTEAHNDATQ